jgi:hypothetical protein
MLTSNKPVNIPKKMFIIIMNNYGSINIVAS